MIQILLCSEGVRDHGRKVYSDGKYIYEDGPLQIFMKSCAAGIEISIIPKTRADVKSVNLLKRKQFINPHADKLAALTHKEGCSHLAYHQDEDNKGFLEIYSQVHELFSAAKEKGIRCLAIVPKHMTESWLLADENAFPERPCDPPLPKSPEEAWGAPDNERYPKRYLSRVLDQFSITPSAETYAEIASKTNVEILKIKCSISFKKFSDDMDEFLADN